MSLNISSEGKKSGLNISSEVKKASLNISSSPHLRDNSTTQRIMLDVIIALIPALLVSIYFFGFRSLLVVVFTAGLCVLFEYISRKLMKRDNTIFDLSAVITGMLLAYNLPPTIPLWICVIGAFIAICVVKQMFGGIGNNFVNPAIAARIVLSVSFPVQMFKWTAMSQDLSFFERISSSLNGSDLISSATPLALLAKSSPSLPSYLDLLVGNKGGCIGEISALALIIGGIYLLYRKVINIYIPITYIGTTALIVAIAGKDPLYHVLSGGLMIGAIFMATDYVTSPLTNKGKIIFGIGCGLITGIIRLYGGMLEGVSFSILLMNIITPHIDNFSLPIPFGGGKKRAKQKV